jgi:predicted alpha/beta superfamily hydrolase
VSHAWRPYPLAGTGGPDAIRLLRATLPALPELLVALPPGYEAESAAYPVLYLHDGQNLFDPATAHAGDWGMVDRLNALARDGIHLIAVGIPNRGRRRRYDYSPFRDIIHGGGGGDRYLADLVDRVRPLIDRTFRTRTGPADTLIAGSSLGGLISLYGLARYPEVFGAAGLLSPALWFAGRAIFDWLDRHPPPPLARIHLDVGLEEGPETIADVRALRDRLEMAGYSEDRLSYREDPGAGHDEAAWGRRLQAALPFLLGRSGPVAEPGGTTSG